MAKSKQAHPIRRVRDAMKVAPPELNLRRYATAAGFAKLIGRSPSHLRNVECGSISSWTSLAKLIESKTKVSSQWLLSDPKADEPILDREGKPWKPSLYLDPLAPKAAMPDWRFLLDQDPVRISELIAGTIKWQLILEMSFGHENSIANMISFFTGMDTFHNRGLRGVMPGVMEGFSKSMLNRAMNSKSGSTGQSDLEIASYYGVEFSDITLPQIETLLRGEGVGWASRLQHPPSQGILADAAKFYAKKYRHSRSSEVEEDESEWLD